MRKVPTILFTAMLVISAASSSADELILRLQPEADAPIITRITATEKVLLDATPASENSDWMRIDLKIPFEGYVSEATLSKGLAIVEDTPVHFLPDASSETITRTKDGDLYEVKRVKDEWATVRFNKALSTYFHPDARASTRPETELEEAPESKPPALDLDLTIAAPTHTPQPKATEFDPSLGVGKSRPDELPAENVVWKSAERRAAPVREPQPQAAATQSDPPRLPDGIMVSPNETQAREADTGEAPPTDQPLRLLVGTLVRKIETADPDYPVRLLSDEGRLIAYVDFSGYFIEDLSPYLKQRVYLRGHLMQAPSVDGELVLFVRDIQIAE